jgi:hypothetical protein
MNITLHFCLVYKFDRIKGSYFLLKHYPMKYYLLLILSVLLTANLSAQSFRGKVIAGFNTSQIDGDGLAGYNKPGPMLGVATEYPFNDVFSVQAEILYSSKGARTSLNQMDMGVNFMRISLQYIDFPIMASGLVYRNLRLEAGPSFAFLVSAREDDGGGYAARREPYRTIDVLGNAGIDYRFWRGLSANARFSYSLWPIGSGRVTNLWVAQGYNNTLSFSLRYHFGYE